MELGGDSEFNPLQSLWTEEPRVQTLVVCVDLES